MRQSPHTGLVRNQTPSAAPSGKADATGSTPRSRARRKPPAPACQRKSPCDSCEVNTSTLSPTSYSASKKVPAVAMPCSCAGGTGTGERSASQSHDTARPQRDATRCNAAGSYGGRFGPRGGTGSGATAPKGEGCGQPLLSLSAAPMRRRKSVLKSSTSAAHESCTHLPDGAPSSQTLKSRRPSRFECFALPGQVAYPSASSAKPSKLSAMRCRNAISICELIPAPQLPASRFPRLESSRALANTRAL